MRLVVALPRGRWLNGQRKKLWPASTPSSQCIDWRCRLMEFKVNQVVKLESLVFLDYYGTNISMMTRSIYVSFPVSECYISQVKWKSGVDRFERWRKTGVEIVFLVHVFEKNHWTWKNNFSKISFKWFRWDNYALSIQSWVFFAALSIMTDLCSSF